MLAVIVREIGRLLLRLRYRIRVHNLEEVAAKGRRGVLFLPNHPALIDPIIMLTELHRLFRPESLADAAQIEWPVARWLAGIFHARPLPDPATAGPDCRDEIEKAVNGCIEDLRHGHNVLLYPAGRIYRSRLEDLGGASAAHTIAQACPGARIVLVRTRGLWGSSFSRAPGRHPHFVRTLVRGAKSLLLSGLFFAPRRRITIEFFEPANPPRRAERTDFNRYLENFYNEDAPGNLYVPYTPWERGGRRIQPETAPIAAGLDTAGVPPATREQVLARLRELTGRPSIPEDAHLARDLGLDSLARLELQVWLEREFGFTVPEGDTLGTVREVILAAAGQAVSTITEELQPIPAAWFAAGLPETGILPPAATPPAAFLAQARRQPGRVILADQTGGARTYRDILTGILALQPVLRQIPGDYLGIMLPASAGAAVLYLAALFAGKTPVMVNWTIGTRNLRELLDQLGVRSVLTAGKLVARIESQGISFDEIRDLLVLAEDLRERISLGAKLRAALGARTGARSLDRAAIPETAVVLFTSGSESRPKLVPLTQANLLANVRDVPSLFRFRPDDRAIGMLPPFHSFGLTITVLLPLCLGVPVVYHPNPTEGAMLARLIEAYRVTIMVGTPTFLNGIIRAATNEQMHTLRVVVTGAEKCPAAVYEAVERRRPGLLVLEGYGVTECAPVVAANTESDTRPGTIGRVLPSFEWAVVDVDTGRRSEPGRPGMLLVRGPCVFPGYLHGEGADPFVEFEGKRWYRTGDLVVAGPDGWLTFAGRLKRFVKVGGEMISLPAVEEVLVRHYGRPEDTEPALAV
ncbi:MAG: 2-acyl-glycerophospho-ethanolamine acyltransferase, partial [Gemmatimonadetes bacterium]|nr:2-acyl-glycerophospho-ethanolamine acyltransferase [Gemmatimonadota bacterium]